MKDLYFTEGVKNITFVSSLDEDVTWIKCPNCKIATFQDVCVKASNGNLYGTCATLGCKTDVLLTP